jgi:S-adenosylmethionine synthetase
MFEKVNPSHPDKIADRIAGAIVDLAYKKEQNPKVAVEVLIGHGVCHVIAETSVHFEIAEIKAIIWRIAGKVKVDYKEHKQDEHLAQNQKEKVRCGDNGIFRGKPVTEEQKRLAALAQILYAETPFDGKYILANEEFIICQSNAKREAIDKAVNDYCDANLIGYKKLTINPLGEWIGGEGVDSGATNRKLGSDMGDAVTGGGLHGKDLSKADVSVNIVCHIKAQRASQEVSAFTAIGDEVVTFRYADGKTESVPYDEVVEQARLYIFTQYGSFEKFAEWGLI